MAAILLDDIFKCILLNENDGIPIQISLKFGPRSPIDNNPALVPNRPQAIFWTNAGPIHGCIDGLTPLGGPDDVEHGNSQFHDDVIKWKHFPRNWPFVRGINRSPVNSPHKDQWRGALMFSLICVWINDWVNNREAGDLRGYRAHLSRIGHKPFSEPMLARFTDA